MDDDAAQVINLLRLAQTSDEAKPAWKLQTADLNLNLVVLDSGGEVGHHTNSEVDVLLIGIEGEGRVDVEGQSGVLAAGHVIVIPKGTSRSIHAPGTRFAYLTCHRRRAGLWPEGILRRDSSEGSLA